MEKLTIDLEHPVIDNSGRPVSQLHLAPPTGAQILDSNWPFAQQRNPRTRVVTETVDVHAAFSMIGYCAGVPFSSVLALQPVEQYECIECLRLFFQVKRRTPSSLPTSPPENGPATATSSSN